MTREDKDLLLKDLSARLPYHVRCKVWLKDGTTEEGPLDLEHNYADVLRDAFYYNKIKNIKPYLRPMSSMTKEERSYYEDRWFEGYHCIHGDDMVSEPEIPSYIDWLNAHHFDYRGLIQLGLAIEVTKENNPYKE